MTMTKKLMATITLLMALDLALWTQAFAEVRGRSSGENVKKVDSKKEEMEKKREKKGIERADKRKDEGKDKKNGGGGATRDKAPGL